MSISTTCPYCAAPVRAADSAAGKTVRCPECQKAIHLRGPDEIEEVAAAAAPAPRKSSRARGQAAKSTKAPALPEDDEDDPDPPIRHKPKKRAQEAAQGATSASALLLILGIGGGVLALLLLAGGGLVWWAMRAPAPEPQANRPTTPAVDLNPEPKLDPKPEPKPNPKPEAEARKAPAGWQTFADKGATFSVFFPEGKVEELPNRNPQTGVMSTAYTVQDKNLLMEYAVLVVDPGVQVPARGGLLEAFKAEASRGQTLLSEQRIKLGDYSGVEQQIRGAGKWTVSRAFEVSGKIFAVAVSISGQELPESAQHIKTCLDSFKIAAAGTALITLDTTPPPNRGVGRPPLGWQVVVAPDGSFSVLFPEGQITTAQQTDPRSGATTTTIAVNDPRTLMTYMVVITAQGRTPMSLAALLKLFKEQLAGDLPLKGEQKIMQGNIPGMAFQWTERGWVNTARAYVVPGRVIAVVVKASATVRPETAANTATCLESFKIPAAGLNMPDKPSGTVP